MPGFMDQTGSGSSHATTWARATLQLAMYELQYVLQNIIINKIISNKQLILVFLLHFSVALAQNTTGVTTTTAMATAGGTGPLLVPHVTPCAPRQCNKWMGDNPPSKRMYFGGGVEGVYGPQGLLCSGNDVLPQHWSVLRTIHTLNSPKNYTRLLRRLLPIHSTCRRGAQVLMWGTRGLFLPAAATDGYGCVGKCWPLEAYVRLTYCRNSKNCLRKYYFIPK